MKLAAALAAAVALAVPASASASAGWTVVRYDHPITSSDRAALDAAGARAVQYRPRNSYVAWLPDGTRVRGARVRALSWQAKLSGSLRGAPAMQALVYGPRARAVQAKLGGVLAPAQPGGDLAELRLDRVPSLRALARTREVLWVGSAPVRLVAEDEATDQVQAGNVSDGAPAGGGYANWLRGVGLNGAGVRMAIVDTGVDSAHPELADRVVAHAAIDDAKGFAGGHGTHVAGIVAGTGSTGTADQGGFLYGLGVAPGAELVDVPALAGTFPRADGNFEVFSREAIRHGAVGWNASWHTGEGTGVGYLESARKMDAIVRDGDFTAAGAQPFTLVFSAGNSGPGESTLTVPHEAKNIISVAASNSHRVQYELGSTDASSIDTIASFSSRGPARDGRIAPTVAAPGQAVMSTSMRPTTDPSNSTCNLPAEPAVARPEISPYHGYCSGTSMAAPHVTGAVALATQWWRGFNGGANPSPAMTKALLVNTARDMGAADVPNPDEGWGRVDLGALFSPGARRVYVDQLRVFGEVGDCYGVRIAPADAAQPLRATLTWTDAPGAPDADPALVNDLDLALTAPDGTAYRGNRLEGGKSLAGGDPDRLNNVEGVILLSPAGSYDLTVDAANLPGDGVPGGDATDQDFALVVSNAVVSPSAPARCGAAAPVEVATPATPAASGKQKKTTSKAAQRLAKARAARKACMRRASRKRPAARRRAAVRRCSAAYKRATRPPARRSAPR